MRDANLKKNTRGSMERIEMVNGNILKQFRLHVRQSQHDISKILKVSQHKISRMEIGKQELPKEWLDELISHYNVEDTWIKNHIPNETEERDYQVEMLQKEVEYLQSRLRDKEQIISIMEKALERFGITSKESTGSSE